MYQTQIIYLMHLINESTTNGFNSVYLTIASLFAIFCSIFVIISKNPIVSVLFLIGLFLSIAMYLMLLGLNFIGISYLLVYVGAVSILFLFILMLINVRISEIFSSTRNSIPLAIMTGTLFFINVNEALPKNDIKMSSNKSMLEQYYNTHVNQNNLLLDNINNNEIYKASPTNIVSGNFKLPDLSAYKNNTLHCVTSGNWDTMLADTYHINILGNIIYTSYGLWLLLTSLILLLAMVGAILITIKN